MAAYIYILTAFSVFPQKDLISRCCLIHDSVSKTEFGYFGTVVSGGIGVDICRFSMGISYMHGSGYEYSAKGYVFSNGFRFSVAYAF